MAYLIETTATVDVSGDWNAGIYQLEQEDIVLGGADGIDNLQAKQLLARINYLKAELVGLGVSDFIRALLDDLDAPAARATLGAVTQDDIDTAIAALVASSPAALDTLNELAAALGNDPNFAATVTATLAAKAPLVSPALTGAPTAPTAAPGTNTNQLATTAFVAAALAALTYARLDVANSWTKGQRGAVVALADGANIALDLSLSNNYSLTLGGNRTLDNPTNAVAGQSGVIVVTQDATGTRLLAYGSNYKAAGGIASLPALSTAAGAIDHLYYYVETPTRIVLSIAKAVA